MIVLAGDIGGTKVDLGLFEGGGDGSALIRDHERYASADHGGLEEICRRFLVSRAASPAAAAFGIAGPIVGDRAEATNLPWVIDRISMEALLGCPVALLNDLESAAHGIPLLAAGEIRVLNEGTEVPRAPRALIAAGTGLGEGYMVYDPRGGRYVPHGSEGGHTDFGPRDEDEIAMLRHFSRRIGRVSVERVVSGDGIRMIFAWLASTGRHPVPPEILHAASGDDGAAAISRAALAGSPSICVETMQRFVASYGAEAGNLALKVLALGGVYVGGGIAPKILPLIEGGLFMKAFADKGRFTGLMSRIPVRVIMNERAALLGAASVAARLGGGPPATARA